MAPPGHTVENLGDQSFNAVYIALKGKSTTTASDSKDDAPLSGDQVSEILADIAQVTAKPGIDRPTLSDEVPHIRSGERSAPIKIAGERQPGVVLSSSPTTTTAPLSALNFDTRIGWVILTT